MWTKLGLLGLAGFAKRLEFERLGWRWCQANPETYLMGCTYRVMVSVGVWVVVLSGWVVVVVGYGDQGWGRDWGWGLRWR